MNIKHILVLSLLTIGAIHCPAQNGKSGTSVNIQTDPFRETGKNLVVNAENMKAETDGKRLALINNDGYAEIKFIGSKLLSIVGYDGNLYQKHLRNVWWIKQERSNQLKLTYAGGKTNII